MAKLKDLIKESTPGFKGRNYGDPLPTLKDVMEKHNVQERTPTPLTAPHDFKKPTVVHISKEELITLYKTGTLETDGITILYGD
tara:strand:- start:271 stop:522 length:252 start_codon:yes stop_codon:yes gene_type:complete